ncbi:MAG: RNA polymerase sigma-70 factor [Dysgonamonadaceae bacterium]|jgi:RNA polymerase sigma-70 factor (ECF subfamily)|nr:RNA polymerase sigma-70 factor [Dysgonamonadaceae bacterium]
MNQAADILFEEMRKGEIKAFEQLYKTFHPKLFAYARRFILDTETIKDLLQELFSDLWNKKESLHIETSVSAFLFKMLHNRCIDYLRSRAAKDRLPSLSALRLSELQHRYYDIEVDPFHAIFTAEINRIVRKTVEDLPPQVKEIFRLSREQGIKSSEIAASLNLSTRTVEKYLYQTLKILKKRLTDYRARR